MTIYVVGSSALHFWRKSALDAQLLARTVVDPLGDCPQSAGFLREALIDDVRFGPMPIHLMVPSNKQRVSKRLFAYSVFTKALPATAFRRLDKDFCVASPELCLLQAARAYSRIRLVELCMEMCGKYALDNNAERGFTSREHQLATPESISSFLQQMEGTPGASELSKMLKNVQEGSRSPMETRAYLLMCLPKRLGGYGLPKPVINQRIELSEEERAMSRRSYFECDLCWGDERVVVEYDGHADHAARIDRDRDSIKHNILLSKRYAVLTLTGGQIANIHAFDGVVRTVAARIEHRLRGFPKDWGERHTTLRRELFKSISHDCGHFA